jgi:8-oxo-dGTP pyrophosphatase MutT (NUDIX family)
MGFAQFRDDGTVFLVRVGGVAVAGGRVLLHRIEDGDFWAMPGGRLEVGETAAECLVREMQEEIGVTVEVDGMLWLIENFFEHAALDGVPDNAEVVAHHEVGVYLAMRLPAHLEATESFWGVELAGTEHEFQMEFRWFPLEQVKTLDVRPGALLDRLSAPLPEPATGVVQRS